MLDKTNTHSLEHSNLSNEKIKNKIVNYWSERVDAFSKQRLKELACEKNEQWMSEITKYIPKNKPLNILDLGKIGRAHV